MGIKEIKLISIPIHILKKEIDEIENKVLIIITVKNNILEKFILIILKKKIKTFINEVWTH